MCFYFYLFYFISSVLRCTSSVGVFGGGEGAAARLPFFILFSPVEQITRQGKARQGKEGDWPPCKVDLSGSRPIR